MNLYTSIKYLSNTGRLIFECSNIEYAVLQSLGTKRCSFIDANDEIVSGLYINNSDQDGIRKIFFFLQED